MMALSLTAEAYGEIRAKLVALGLGEARVIDTDGLETLLMDEFVLTKEKGDDNILVFVAYNGKVLRRPK